MKQHFSKFVALALATAIGVPFMHANPNSKFEEKIKKLKSEVKPVREFRGEIPWDLSAKGKAINHKTGVNTRSAVNEPDLQFENIGTYDFLEAPDGSTWFYTAEYEKEYYEVSEWYTEQIIKAFKFTIYDSQFNLVGTIADEITLQPGESKVAYIALDPAVTSLFFNDDSNYEVMVYIAMNTSAEFGYEVNYYNKVYSINGEKDENGNDICLGIMNGRCVDSLNASSSEENFYFSFAEDIYPDMDDFDFDDFIDYVKSVKTSVKVYGKYSGDETPSALEKDILFVSMPGDTTEGIYLISFSEAGVPYYVFSFYEKPYFVDPTGMATDESITPDNSLVIETYTLKNGAFELISETKIPVETPDIDEQLAYYFYSIGSVSWKNDIDTKVNGTLNAPAYIVARDYVLASQPDDNTPSYFIYGNDGKMIRTLAENTDAINLLNSEIGDQPHAMFVTRESYTEYAFTFVYLYCGEKLFVLDQNNNEDPLTASCQRIKGKDGKYKYAFEMEYDDLDDDSNDIKRIAWYNQDGSFDRIDYINMGKDVMYAAINMYPECLSPYVFDSDDAMEYAVLVKRAYGNTTRSEFLVVDDNGERYAHFSEDDGYGYPVMFSILPGEPNSLMMVYGDDYAYNLYIYNLPFVSTTGVNEILSSNGLVEKILNYDGENMTATGCFIEVYSISGVKMTEGYQTVSFNRFNNKGLYVVKLTDSKGKTKSLKMAI